MNIPGWRFEYLTNMENDEHCYPPHLLIEIVHMHEYKMHRQQM